MWDNCAIHKSWEVKHWLAENDPEMQLIYNIPYRPDLNGIELVWKDCKHRYRGRVDYYKANNVTFDHQALVEDIV